MHQFLLASRQGATRRQRLLLGSVSFALLVAVVLALAAFYQYQVADTGAGSPSPGNLPPRPTT